MPSSQFYFLVVFTAELAPFSISHSWSNAQAAQSRWHRWLTWVVIFLEASQFTLIVFLSGLSISYGYTGDLLLVWTTILAACGSLHHWRSLPPVLTRGLGFGSGAHPWGFVQLFPVCALLTLSWCGYHKPSHSGTSTVTIAHRSRSWPRRTRLEKVSSR